MDNYIYDEYSDYDDLDYVHTGDADFEEFFPTVESLLQCIVPSLRQICRYIGVYLIWNGIFAVTTQTTKIPPHLRHLISIICGISILYYTFGFPGLFHIITNMGLAVLVFHVAMRAVTKNMGFLVAGSCIGTVILQEFLESDFKKWHQIRGSLLITTMKLISLAFDVDANRVVPSKNNASHHRAKPRVLETFGYLLCPANCIMGPWVSFNDYLAAFEPSRVKWTPKWFFWITLNVGAAVGLLLCSNCLIISIFGSTSFRWILGYRDAMSFRFSHYFVSYMSQALVVLASYSDSPENKRCASPRWGFLITNPLHIEFPRSLVNVVVVWNMSMHFWLRTYVFRMVRPYGTFTAIIATYAVSALLHGLNFQLAAVLLSLGFFTFTEHQLRLKLANVFSACIAATACKDACEHRHKWRHPYVLAVNFVFGVVAVMNLAYLGLMFGENGELQEEGFSYLHTLNRWQSLGFLSHWIVAGAYMFYRII